MSRFGIYVHIPFCKKKCDYCDFISFSCSEEKIDKYFIALEKEISLKKVDYEGEVTTIYIGGGTPSFVDSKYIRNVLEKIKKKYNVSKDAEITIEVNPGTVTEKKIKDYKNAGINRISIGLQSANDRILKLIGRIHTYEEFLECYKLVRKCGYDNVTVDLMLGIPTQTEEDLLESLEKVINLNPEHISVYSLIVEDETVLKKKIDNKELILPEEELERKMYWDAKKVLEKNDYIHYEISNFSKKGFESKHNLDCWNQQEYIGFGLSAHSYFKRKRFSNTYNFNKYIDNLEKTSIIHEEQDNVSQMKEYMMLGFRKIEGISIEKFKEKFNIDPLKLFKNEINELLNFNLIQINLDKIKLTDKGLDFANMVFEKFV